NVAEQVYVKSSENEEGNWFVVVQFASGCIIEQDCPQRYSLVSEWDLSSPTLPLSNESLPQDSSLRLWYPLELNHSDSSWYNVTSVEGGAPTYTRTYTQFDGVDDKLTFAELHTGVLSNADNDFTIALKVMFLNNTQTQFFGNI